jgi:Double zinc ribbon
MQCPRCARQNPPHQKFCGECGTPLQHLDGTTRPAPSYADLQHSLIEARDQQATTSERLREALAQQTATADILRVISNSPIDASPVFSAIAESAARLTGAVLATVYEFDGSQVHLRAIEPSDYPQILLEEPQPPINPARRMTAQIQCAARKPIS